LTRWKTISLKIPEAMLECLDQIIRQKQHYPSRSELIREAISKIITENMLTKEVEEK